MHGGSSTGSQIAVEVLTAGRQRRIGIGEKIRTCCVRQVVEVDDLEEVDVRRKAAPIVACVGHQTARRVFYARDRKSFDCDRVIQHSASLHCDGKITSVSSIHSTL